ncbi:hypothetical protein H5410_057696 [Solanum commersonii]|uniref:RNase H type-1 domain-containing protein n=1 Tax=Solanum commersonii TaxID=4109 RepID=A0A9J5WPQ0_SOLCO|nr:hypothetical protein H5410_057696 [Solanum commersonii]
MAGKGGTGGVFRDEKGNWVLGYMGSYLGSWGTPIHHDFRETNGVADALAREGSMLQHDNSFLCLEIPPMFVSDKMETDKEGTPFIRLKKPHFVSDNCNSTFVRIPPPPDPIVRHCSNATPMY